MTEYDATKLQRWQKRPLPSAVYRATPRTRTEKVAATYKGEDERMERLLLMRDRMPETYAKLDTTLKLALGTYLNAKAAHQELEGQS